jgi:hypothetical protein
VLCQTVHKKLRADKNLPGSAPTSTTSQTGLLGEIVTFVDDAYEAIQQLLETWNWRRLQGTFNTTASTRSYSTATIQSSLPTFDILLPMNGQYGDQRYILCHLTSTGVGDQTPVFFRPYEVWRGYFDQGTRPTGKPTHFTFRPDGTLELDPTPDAIYTLTFDYRRTLHALAADGDEPIIPAKFQDAIVWGAILEYCATRDNVQDLERKAMKAYDEIMGIMRSESEPEPRFYYNAFFG